MTYRIKSFPRSLRYGIGAIDISEHSGYASVMAEGSRGHHLLRLDGRHRSAGYWMYGHTLALLGREDEPSRARRI